MTGAWALRSLLRHPVRATLVVTGVVIAAALLVDMIMLRGGMERSFERLLLGRGFEIRLSPKGTLPFDTEATIPGVTSLLAELRADPEVVAAGPVVATSVAGVSGAARVPLVGYGIDPAEQGLYELLQGEDLRRADSAGLLIGQPTAGATGWSIGDTVSIEGRLDPQTAEPLVSRRLVVRGVVRWLYDARDQRSVGTVLPVMQSLGGHDATDAVSLVMVNARDGAAPDSVAARLARRYPSIEVNSIGAVLDQFRGRLVYFRQLSLILATISLVVAVLLIGTIQTIAVGERLGEIAVLRAIGVTRGRIIRAVALEGAAVTVVGAVGGVMLGLVTARYLDRILTSFPGLPQAISFFVPAPLALAEASLWVLVAGFLAGLYPAWLAARAPIAAVLRSEAD